MVSDSTRPPAFVWRRRRDGRLEIEWREERPEGPTGSPATEGDEDPGGERGDRGPKA
jgi:hypothetical protein